MSRYLPPWLQRLEAGVEGKTIRDLPTTSVRPRPTSRRRQFRAPLAAVNSNQVNQTTATQFEVRKGNCQRASSCLPSPFAVHKPPAAGQFSRHTASKDKLQTRLDPGCPRLSPAKSSSLLERIQSSLVGAAGRDVAVISSGSPPHREDDRVECSNCPKTPEPLRASSCAPILRTPRAEGCEKLIEDCSPLARCFRMLRVCDPTRLSEFKQLLGQVPLELSGCRTHGAGDTMLHLACMHSAVGYVRHLIDQNSVGDTALHVCYMYRDTKLANLLEASGADPRMKNLAGVLAGSACLGQKAQKSQPLNLHKVLPPRLLRKVSVSPEWHRKKQKKKVKKRLALQPHTANNTMMKQYVEQLHAGELGVA